VQVTASALREMAHARAFAAPAGLAETMRALGFVQMDPLRAPARAQDLILRPRVADYRAGDLARSYASLQLSEDYLHVHGAMPGELRRLLYPRSIERQWRVEKELPQLGSRIVDFIGRNGPTHPRELHRAFGRAAVVNGWGGQSAATTRMLEVLHYRGTLRVVRRDQGIRVYDIAPVIERPLTPRTRLLRVLELLLGLYAPLPERSLRELARMAADAAFDVQERERILARFVRRDTVASTQVDRLTYLWPAGEGRHRMDDGSAPARDKDSVRLVAPFDPLVWDRRRFAHLHGWGYRFEAYTPAAHRRFGYYALPLFWRGQAIGWANVARRNGTLDVQAGYVARRPAGRGFAQAFDAELARLEVFLQGYDAAER
jgi:uncharacterized protein YcaQ